MMTRPITTMFAALAVAGLLGACGGGGSEGGSEGGSGEGSSGEQAGGDGQELYDWVECMAGKGIELPEPSRNADDDLVIVGDGVNIGGGPGEPPSFGEYSEEEFQAGTDVCGPPPILAGLSEESRQEEEDNALAFSQCMRDNGIDDFPDPDFSLLDDPSEGVASPWPPEAMEGIESDPDFQAAREACLDIMIPGGAEPAGEGEDSDG
jgi:hypothetical protein